MDYLSQIKANTDKINQNIQKSKKLRKQQMTYNGFATLTALSAIASYSASAVTIEQQEHTCAIAFLAAAIVNNLASIYCLVQSNKKGRAAMDVLKHNIKTKVK